MAPTVFCLAGGQQEYVQSEYAFLGSVRYQLHGTRDIVVTPWTQLVNFATLRSSISSADLAKLTDVHAFLKQMSAKDAGAYLQEPTCWIERSTLEAGAMLYLPVVVAIASAPGQITRLV